MSSVILTFLYFFLAVAVMIVVGLVIALAMVVVVLIAVKRQDGHIISSLEILSRTDAADLFRYVMKIVS